MTDQQLLRRYNELSYRLIEIQLDPDHPASRANGARWKREHAQVVRAMERRLRESNERDLPRR